MPTRHRPDRRPEPRSPPPSGESAATREAIVRMIGEGSPPPLAKRRADDADRAEGGDSLTTPRDRQRSRPTTPNRREPP